MERSSNTRGIGNDLMFIVVNCRSNYEKRWNDPGKNLSDILTSPCRSLCIVIRGIYLLFNESRYRIHTQTGIAILCRGRINQLRTWDLLLLQKQELM